MLCQDFSRAFLKGTSWACASCEGVWVIQVQVQVPSFLNLLLGGASGEIHVPAALPFRKEPPLAIE
jgi:hypothetical protein